MGEAKRKILNGGIAGNGHVVPSVLSKKIRVVTNLRLENKDDGRVTILMLGDASPELATVLTPDQAEQLAEHLIRHAKMIRDLGSRIIIPGIDFTP